MRGVVLLSVLMSSTLSTLAQTGVKGALYDAVNDSPIEYGSVAIYNQNDSLLISGAVSSLEGSFAVVGLNHGDYYLSATFMGYETTFVSSISITKSGVIDLGRIAIRPNQTMLDEIEVKGEKAAAIHQIDRQVYGAEQFQSAKGGTATDLLRNLPSVTVNAQGEITARGASGFVVLINGKPVQTDAATILNQLPANAVQNIELITAPSAKYDPEGKGGIINVITTSKDAADGTYVQANLRAGTPSIQNYDNARYAQRYGLDFTLNHRADKWDVSIGASLQRNDIAGRREGDVWTMRGDTLTRFPSDGERSTDEINYSGRVTLGYSASKADNFSLGVYAGKRNTDRTADILYYDNYDEYQGTRLRTMQYFNENLRTRTGDFALGSFDYSHQFDNSSLLSASVLYEYTLLGGPTTNRNLG
ncbi:MAG: TonB-dependent receptor plug domain-containing protein [Imperialibacter sp.]